MKQQLEILDQYIQTLRPDYYRHLNKGLTEEELAGIEASFSIKLPEDLKELYKWKNGQSDENYEAFVNNSMFLPLEFALESATELNSMIGFDFEIENWWSEQWIPMFDNGGGDHICYDMKGIFTGVPGQILEFWHSDSDRNIIAFSLSDFLKNINEYYSQGDVDEFIEIELDSNFPKEFVLE